MTDMPDHKDYQRNILLHGGILLVHLKLNIRMMLYPYSIIQQEHFVFSSKMLPYKKCLINFVIIHMFKQISIILLPYPYFPCPPS